MLIKSCLPALVPTSLDILSIAVLWNSFSLNPFVSSHFSANAELVAVLGSKLRLLFCRTGFLCNYDVGFSFSKKKTPLLLHYNYFPRS